MAHESAPRVGIFPSGWFSKSRLSRLEKDARAFVQPTTLLGAMMIAVVWIAVVHMAAEKRGAAEREAIRHGNNLTRALEEHISRIIKSTDSALLVLRRLHAEGRSDAELRRWIEDGQLQNDLLIHFAIADRDGDVAFSSMGPLATKANVADRDHFKLQKRAERDELTISPPVVGATSGKWSIQLTRRLVSADGSFDGIIVAALDPFKLQKFFESIDLGDEGVASLVGFDGLIRSRGAAGNRTGASYIGHSFGRARMFDSSPPLPSGVYWNGQNRLDGVSRLVSYRVVEGFPLFAVVGLAENDILQQANAERRAYYEIAFVLSVIIVFLVILGGIRERQLHDATAALSDANTKLGRTNMRFRAALENMPLGLCMFDREQRLIVSNRRWAEMYALGSDAIRPGMTLEDVLRARISAGTSPEDGDAYLRDRLAEIAGGKAHDKLNFLQDGRILAVNHKPVEDGGWVAVHQDITSQKRAEAEIVHLACHDALTGLANRTVLIEEIGKALARIRRSGGEIALYLLDLDHFKAVNDSLGHPVGDALLTAVSKRLGYCVGETDVVARLGGDEFAILQAFNVEGRDQSVLIANRLIDLFSSVFDLDGHQVMIGTSIGIVFGPGDGTTAEELLKNADLALYQAKAKGRNGYHFFEPQLEIAARSRQALEVDLRRALIEHEFEVHYQPVIDGVTRTVCAMEALVRWRHPTRGLIAPDKFIPVAEETGIVVALGEWVLRRACSDAMSWPAHMRVAVNLSPVQFMKGRIIETVGNALTETGLTSDRLELEITESVLLQRNEENLTTLHTLRNLGVAIVLDDFGTGYASLSYLRSFPFDKIKIDRSFVSELATRADCAAIVCAIANLGRGLNISTVAEGVETEDQFQLVRAAGCTQVQGYLFGRPRPVSDIDIGTFSPRAA